MRHEASRDLGDRVPARLRVVGHECGRDGQRVGRLEDVVGRRPVRAALVERIQDDVAAGLVVALRQELERGVVHDRALTARGDLIEDLADDHRRPGADVAHDQGVMRFEPT